MILHDAVERLREVAEGSLCEDGVLAYASLPKNHICRFCKGSCLGVEYGGRVAEVSTTEPFTAKMQLDNLYAAPLKSEKTRAASAGALTAAAGFLMLTRILGPCPTVNFEDCLEELVRFCEERLTYIIGEDIPELNQALLIEEADLVLVTGDAVLSEERLTEIDEARSFGKEILFLGPSWSGTAALLGLTLWCPYGT